MDFVIILILLLIVGLSSGYIIRSKKKGKGCIGCPYSGSCSSCCSGKKE